MRRKQAFWGGVVSVLVAGFVGYLVSSWFPVSHSRELSAAQMVALRFPQDLDDDTVASTSSLLTAAAAQTVHAESSLLSPEPMAPQASVVQASATSQVDSDVAPPMQLQAVALARPAKPSAPVKPVVAAAASAQPRSSIAAAAQASVAKLAAAAHRLNERPGFVLNDAQIASIKQRLHLTADQEEMWPAVEAALRNLAYTRAHDSRGKGAAASAQIAQTDPNSPEVQGLKSAAIPLIMSFSSEQKDEVRNLAHVMGLDQLASQF